MASNNAINNQGLASSAEAIAGVVTDKLITPATLKATLDTFTPSDLAVNLGMSISGGVLTITTADGTALSSTSPVRLKIPSKAVPGTVVPYVLTTPQSVSESDLTGNLFGTTASVAWSESKPFFIYAVHNDAENDVCFMISAIPHRYVSPASANIGKAGSAVADTQGSFFALGNPTVTDYDGNNLLLMGSFRMTKNSSDAWTLVSMDAFDGIGRFNARYHNMPSGQQTAASGEWWRPNGGTAPVFTTNTYKYYLDKTGYCGLSVLFDGDGGTDGSGSVNAQLTLPYTSDDSLKGSSCELSFVGSTMQAVIDFNDLDYAEFYRSDSGINKLQYSVFTNGTRSVKGLINYNVSVA